MSGQSSAHKPSASLAAGAGDRPGLHPSRSRCCAKHSYSEKRCLVFSCHRAVGRKAGAGRMGGLGAADHGLPPHQDSGITNLRVTKRGQSGLMGWAPRGPTPSSTCDCRCAVQLHSILPLSIPAFSNFGTRAFCWGLSQLSRGGEHPG